MKILLLRTTSAHLDAHDVLFANTFLARGDEVCVGLVNTVATHNYHVYGFTVPYRVEVELLKQYHAAERDELGKQEVLEKFDFGGIDEPLKWESLENFDLIWVMKSPHPDLAKDIWQILWLLAKRVPFVNSVEALLFLNTKNTFGYLVPQEHLLENHVANSFDILWEVYRRQPQERWVLKPTNSGGGTDVFLVDSQGSNDRALIQSMTGNTKSIVDPTIGDSLLGLQNKYAVLQKFASEVQHGEKRVIIAGGEVITAHGRVSVSGEHRSNLFQGGQSYASALTEQEEYMCSRLTELLLANGVGYVGLDISYPYILEFNMIDPGGLARVLLLTGTNYASRTIDCIIKTRTATGHVSKQG